MATKKQPKVRMGDTTTWATDTIAAECGYIGTECHVGARVYRFGDATNLQAFLLRCHTYGIKPTASHIKSSATVTNTQEAAMVTAMATACTKPRPMRTVVGEDGTITTTRAPRTEETARPETRALYNRLNGLVNADGGREVRAAMLVSERTFAAVLRAVVALEVAVAAAGRSPGE